MADEKMVGERAFHDNGEDQQEAAKKRNHLSIVSLHANLVSFLEAEVVVEVSESSAERDKDESYLSVLDLF